jgi:hypothetical protein
VRQRRLADAGQIFDQQMAAREQAARARRVCVSLAEDHRLAAARMFGDGDFRVDGGMACRGGAIGMIINHQTQ